MKMKHSTAVLALLLFLFSLPILAQQQQQQQQQQQEQESPPPPPRVVGQARSQAEFDAFQAVQAATDPSQKIQLAKTFLETYPDSGLSAHTHQIMAQAYDQLGDIGNFIIHAEESLKELPNSFPILARIVFVAAERGQSSEMVITRADKALELMASAEKPQGLDAAQWVRQLEQLRADAKYAKGRVHLNRFQKANVPPEERENSPKLKAAASNFYKALENDPRHDFASLRLGFVETLLNHPTQAADAYSMAVATGGIAAGAAQERLDQLHKFMQENLPDTSLANKNMGEILQEGSNHLQGQVAKKEQELLQKAQAIRQKELEQQQTVPPPSPPPAEPPLA